MSELLAEIKKLGSVVEEQGKRLDALSKKSANQPSTNRVFGIRKGENTMASRKYSFLKAMGLYKGHIGAEHARLEADVSNKLIRYMKESGYERTNDRNMLIPMWLDAISDEAIELRNEIKSLIKQDEIDHDEVAWITKRAYQKDLSWLTDTAGGSLVPMAAQGDLIEYLRNRDALINAGASTFPLPPQGSLSLPKQTGAMTAYWIGENTSITKSDVTTGSVMLRAKKLGCRGGIPNELFRYSNPAADAIVRNDVARVLALALDLAGLEGTGGTQPTGLIVGTGGQAIGTYTATKTATDGNTFQPQDWSKMLGVIENSNGIINEEAVGFICRPKFYRFADTMRADAVSAGDMAGAFVELMKRANDSQELRKAGKRVTLSNQVSGTRTKGAGTTLSYVICGDWSQLLMGMGAVVELDMNPYGDTPWASDQTEIRGILQADIAHRHKESFVWCDQLLQA